MEKPTYTAIDYNSKENKVIEERIRNYYLLETAFWFPMEHNAERIKILECALEDLERIKREGEPKLPPLTFEEPKIYP
jgi:hypothetical protein